MRLESVLRTFLSGKQQHNQTSLPQPLRTENIKGSFDKCDEHGTVTGWVFDKLSANEPLHVEIIADGAPVACTTADTFRADLLQSGVGDGKHGFEVMLPDYLLDGKEHVIEIREVSTGIVLPGLPNSVKTFQGLHSKKGAAGKINYTDIAIVPGVTKGYFGFIDSITEEGVHGWVLDAENINEPLNVSIFLGKELIGTVTAQEPRADIANVLGLPVHPGLYFNWKNVNLPERTNKRDQEEAEITFIIERNDLQIHVREQPKIAELYYWVAATQAISTMEQQLTVKEEELFKLQFEYGQKIQELEKNLILQETIACERGSELTKLLADSLVREDELTRYRATSKDSELLLANNKKLEALLAERDKMTENLWNQLKEKDNLLATYTADLTHLRQKLAAHASWKAELQKDMQRIEQIIKSA